MHENVFHCPTIIKSDADPPTFPEIENLPLTHSRRDTETVHLIQTRSLKSGHHESGAVLTVSVEKFSFFTFLPNKTTGTLS